MVPAGHAIIVAPARRVGGLLRVPGDKSISHRALLLSLLADGQSSIENLAPGDDCRATLACIQVLGADVTRVDGGPHTDVATLRIRGVGLRGLAVPAAPLDACNSGTTARLLMGVLAGASFASTLVGDASLQRRPMRRVVDPLSLMGARITTADGRLPARLDGQPLVGIDYTLPVPSAQVKSAILLAGLTAAGSTTVRESHQTRNHTELALRAFGVSVNVQSRRVSVSGNAPLTAAHVRVPGDPSSAAFWAVAAAALPGSSLEIRDVGLNPTRTQYLGVLRRFGATVHALPSSDPDAEVRGTIIVHHGALGHVVITPDEVPGLIDELPALAALATHGGRLSVTGASELRVKESDRISALARGLRQMGAHIDEAEDGFSIDGASKLRGGEVDAAGDHRLAMAFAIAALGAAGPTTIVGADSVSISYPGFFDVLERIRQ
jgi:3-phosphoshikimate 1-carboxyvinyltransferase